MSFCCGYWAAARTLLSHNPPGPLLNINRIKALDGRHAVKSSIGRDDLSDAKPLHDREVDQIARTEAPREFGEGKRRGALNVGTKERFDPIVHCLGKPPQDSPPFPRGISGNVAVEDLLQHLGVCHE